MKRTVFKCVPLMAALYGTSLLSASTIESFSITPVSSPFTTNLTDSFTSSEATIMGSVACDSTTACSGELYTFNLGLDLTNAGALSITTEGSLTGDKPGTGSENLISPITQTRGFNVPLGSFDYTRYSSVLPALGVIDVTGSLDLTLQPGQVLTLPITINFVSTVPEPSGQVLLLLGVLGVAAVFRYRYLRAARN